MPTREDLSLTKSKEIREEIANRIFDARRVFSQGMSNPDYCTLEDCNYYEGTDGACCEYCFADQILTYLDSKGVVIKVDRELGKDDVPCGVPCDKCVAVENLIDVGKPNS